MQPYSNSSFQHSRFRVGIKNVADYSPFGVQLNGRTISTTEYRIGFQNQEKDDEVKGEGNSYTTEFRQYDPRLGRWLSLDPLVKKYPDVSPYASFYNNPCLFVDLKGDSIKVGNGISGRIIKAILSKLTYDNLIINKKNGNIEIGLMGGAARPGENRAIGTDLLRKLVGHENDVHITLSLNGENHTIAQGDQSKSSNGEGSETVLIEIDKTSGGLNNVFDKIKNKTVLEDVKPQIALAHELIHAYHCLEGESIPLEETEINSYEGRDGKRYKETQPKEELKTVGLIGNEKYTENAIRKEQGENKRVSYGKTK